MRAANGAGHNALGEQDAGCPMQVPEDAAEAQHIPEPVTATRAAMMLHAADAPYAAPRAHRPDPIHLMAVVFPSHPCGFLPGKASQRLRSNHVAPLPSPQDPHDVIPGAEP